MRQHITIDQLLELDINYLQTTVAYYKVIRKDESLLNVDLTQAIEMYKAIGAKHRILVELAKTIDIAHMLAYIEESNLITITKTGIDQEMVWYVLVESIKGHGCFVKESPEFVDALWDCSKECVKTERFRKLHKQYNVIE
jgi:hypothetical protein